MTPTMDPPLTTIDVSKRKIGSLAITVLAEQIRSQVSEPAVKILVGADLVMRDSVTTKAPKRTKAAAGGDSREGRGTAKRLRVA